jgi:hypothetical protein
MATNTFSNLPTTPPPSNNSVDSVVNTFNSLYTLPIQLNAGAYNAMVGFFQNKGFDVVASQSITLVIMTQCQQDNINPMTIIDSLRGQDAAALSVLATQILNYNRFKSSYLGIADTVAPFFQVQRNIIA